MSNTQEIKKILQKIPTGICNKNIGDYLLNIVENEKTVVLHLAMPYPCKSKHKEIVDKVNTALKILDKKITVEISQKIKSYKIKKDLPQIKGIKNIIGISSCKGGVGKTTVATNIALLAAKEGAKVGILDADIYGPSIPVVMKIKHSPKIKDDKMQVAIEKGVKVMSIAFLTENSSSLSLRAPMATSYLMQMLENSDWGELDYLFIDMPPGTGDIHLTLAQKVPITTTIVVTTPQDLAIADITRGIDMFNKTNVDIIGIVENMSYYKCPCCDNKDYIFSKNKINTKKEMGVETIGEIPIKTEKTNNDDAYLGIMHKITTELSYRKVNLPSNITELKIRPPSK